MSGNGFFGLLRDELVHNEFLRVILKKSEESSWFDWLIIENFILIIYFIYNTAFFSRNKEKHNVRSQIIERMRESSQDMLVRRRILHLFLFNRSQINLILHIIFVHIKNFENF